MAGLVNWQTTWVGRWVRLKDPVFAPPSDGSPGIEVPCSFGVVVKEIVEDGECKALGFAPPMEPEKVRYWTTPDNVEYWGLTVKMEGG